MLHILPGLKSTSTVHALPNTFSKALHSFTGSFTGSLRLGALVCLVLAGLAATRLLLPALADTAGRPDVIWMRGGHTADVSSMDYSPDGQLFASIGDQVGAVKIWRLSDGMLLRTINVFAVSAYQVKFLSDSQTIVVTGSESNATFDQRIKRVRVSDGQIIWSRILSDNSASIHVTSGGNIFNIGNGFQIYNSADGALLRSSNQAFYRTSNGTPINFGRFGPVGAPAANGNMAGSILPDAGTYSYAAIIDPNDCYTDTSNITRCHLVAHFPGLFSGASAITPDSSKILSYGGPNLTNVYRVSDGCYPGQSCSQPPAPSAVVTLTGDVSPTFSHDGQALAISTSNPTPMLYIYDIATWSMVRMLPHVSRGYTTTVFSPDNQIVANSSATEGTPSLPLVNFWSVSNGNLAGILNAHIGGVAATAFSPDSQFFATGDGRGSNGSDGVVHIWRTSDGTLLTYFVTDPESVNSIAFAPGGQHIATGGNRGIKLWNTTDGTFVKDFGANNSANSLIFSPDGSKLLTGGGTSPRVNVWDVQTGNVIRSFLPDTGSTRAVAISPDGQTMAATDGTAIWFWNMADPIFPRSLTTTGNVSCIAFSPDSQSLIAGLEEQNGDNRSSTIKQWRVSTGVPIRVYTGHTNFIESVAFSPNGLVIMSGGADGIRTWDVLSGAQLRYFDEETVVLPEATGINILSIAFSPDGSKFGYGRFDATAVVARYPANQPPVANAGLDQTAVEATGPSGALISLDGSQSSDPDGSIVTYEWKEGANVVAQGVQATLTVSLGTHTFVLTVTDDSGSVSSDTVDVTIVDRTPPTLTLPADLSVTATSEAGAVATFTSSASDIVDGSVTPICTPASGSTFPIGITTVNCTATDAQQNSSQATFTVNVTSSAATSTSVLISEFRLRGPLGANDEFVEVYNNSDQPITVSTTDGSSGWALVTEAGYPFWTIPNGTVIPARGHLLGSEYYNQGSSIHAYAQVNTTWGYFDGFGIPDNTGLALFQTADSANFNSANRIDAVGFTPVANPLYREGTGLASTGANDADYTFVRKTTGFNVQDTGNNAADFLFVSTTGAAFNGVQSTLGAPGFEGGSSPIMANLPGASGLTISLLDAAAGPSSEPNQARNLQPIVNGSRGTLELRRKITNYTGVTLTSLRLRVVDITTQPAAAGLADLRVLSSSDLSVNTSAGNITVKGTTLEQPPNQFESGGGLNSSLRVPLPSGGLAPGASVSTRFLLGVRMEGDYRFELDIPLSNSQGVLTSGQNPTPSIFGRVAYISNGPPTGFSGVTVTLSGAQSATTVTDLNGNYSFDGLQVGGNYTVTPSKLGFVFQPGSVSVNALAGNQAVNFTGELPSPDAGEMVISEFRFRGTIWAGDEFVELYNNTDQTFTVSTTDGSTGWTVIVDGGYQIIHIPNGTLIPARAHFIGTEYYNIGSGSALSEYTQFDATWGYYDGFQMPDDTGIALFKTANPANFTAAKRLDAVGFTSVSSALYREGAGLAPLGTDAGEYSFVRKMNGFTAQDSDNNITDFVLVSTTGATFNGLQSVLGAAGPEGLSSPIRANRPGADGLVATLLDQNVPEDSAPNYVRLLTPVANGSHGILELRRKIINTSNTTLTSVRLRVNDFTTLGSGDAADLRVLSSPDLMVTLTNGSSVLVKGTTLDQPPNQVSGGGLNSSLSVALPSGGLAPGASINIRFVLGVEQTGSYRFQLDIPVSYIQNEILNWANVTPTNGAPTPRSGHRLIYDSARSKVVLFGGTDAQGNYLNDIWEWDTASQTWTNVTPATGEMPIPRSNFGMAYDVARAKVIIYGGNCSTQFSNVSITGDTWEWDGATHSWTQKPASTIVFVGLWGAVLSYDPNLGKVILFGGEPYWGYPTNDGTYAWDGNNWNLVASSGPSGRVQHAMGTDTRRSRVVMFGGHSRSDSAWTTPQDTWEWNGQSWVRVSLDQGPSPRDGAAMAYDSRRGVSYLFGGIGYLQDTWEWNGTGWQQQQTASSPSPRATSLAYDASQSRLVLFGGASSNGPLGDTYLLAAISSEDATPPATNAGPSPVSNAAGWHNSDVVIALNAMDNSDGSGVGDIVYSASGAQVIPSTTVGGAATSLTISAEGITTLAYFATDNAGNAEAVKFLTVKIDKTAPAVSCGVADGLWHVNDVGVPCTANDLISGLATIGDSSFTLITDIPNGSESANAQTNDQTVCDVAGNCTNAGPIAGNKVDKKPPAVTILSPTNTVYRVNAVVAASYMCADGGSGAATCVGTVPSGTNINTALPIGPRLFTVGASDAVRNTSSAGVTYTVLSPLVSLSTASVKFADQRVGTIGDAQTVTVSNVGNDVLLVGNTSLGGSNPSEFKITSDTCKRSAVAPGGNCTVSVAFAPTAAGGRKATLLISDDAPDTPQGVALTGNGVIPRGYAWGANFGGQLGDGTTTQRLTPVQVSGLSGVPAFATGYSHSLALKSDGTIWAWGDNTYGQLGDNSKKNRKLPVRVIGLTGVTALAASYSHSLAVKSDGTVWAWGNNGNGQLGDGTTTQRLTPVRVSGLSGVTAIAAGTWHGLAAKSDGSVWAWGYNGNGQLGDGTTTQRLTPVRVSGLTGARALAAGYYHSLAVKSDGTVWAWGDNTDGQLGDGTTTQRLTLVRVSGLSGVTAIAAAAYHSLAVKSNGTGWAWGDNTYGQLGDGTTTQRLTPVRVIGLTGVTAVAAGIYHSLALNNDTQ